MHDNTQKRNPQIAQETRLIKRHSQRAAMMPRDTSQMVKPMHEQSCRRRKSAQHHEQMLPDLFEEETTETYPRRAAPGNRREAGRTARLSCALGTPRRLDEHHQAQDARPRD